METVVIDGQNLFDIAVQESGTIEAIFDLAIENGLSITEQLFAGDPLNIPTIGDAEIAGYFKGKNICPATGHIEEMGGIGYMAISIDFVIS